MADAAKNTQKYQSRLKVAYNNEIRAKLIASGKFKNVMQVPKISKVVISCSLKDALLNPKALEGLAEEITNITGQKAAITKAKKAISNFKLRQGINLGCVVTLRRERMYDFLDRFINIACPRIRDFKGFPEKSFDGRGNYSLGVKEHTIFPETADEDIKDVFGLAITVVSSAKNKKEATSFFELLGVPFKKEEGKK